MGLKLKDLSKEGRKSIKFRKIKGNTLAVDAFNIIFQFLSTIRERNGDLLRDSEGRVISHLLGLFYKSVNFCENQIRPIFIYDGKPPDLKTQEIEKRKRAKKEAEKSLKKYRQEKNLKKMKKYAKRTSSLNNEMIKESKELLQNFGFPIVQAPSEAEAQASYLVNNEDAWGAFTKDYDVLAFGSKRVIRNLKLTKKNKPQDNEKIHFISLERLLLNLDITQSQLVEMTILMGNDYFPGIKGIGEKTALKLIKKYGSISEINKESIKIRGHTINIDQDLVEEIKEIFLRPNITTDYGKLCFSDINYVALSEFMIEKHEFSEKKISDGLERIK